MNSNNNQIDFVITWVDPTDPVWTKEFNYYKFRKECIDTSNLDVSNARYRDWGLLKYWFRGVEEFAPWVRYIHFVTYGHLPSWLDVTNPKLRIVKHEDYIPKQYLPVFNSNPIELMMHRIPDLSDRFVYFNDDYYLIKPVLPTYFFRVGKPCDMAVAKNHHSMEGVMLGIAVRNMEIINSKFNLILSILTHPSLWFRTEYKGFLKLTLSAVFSGKIISLLDTHAPTPYLKDTFEIVWNNYGKMLEPTMSHRFRSGNDVSHWLFRYWQIAQGKIFPKNVFSSTKLFYSVGKNMQQVQKVLLEGEYSVVVLNDSTDIEDIDTVIYQVNSTFSSLLPNKSQFEK